ncbi:L-ascorbate oxidase [Cyathus striatus]|nr:L-ascorbate oxidase [Cyathus striatus]
MHYHRLGTALLLWLATFSDLSSAYRWPSPQYDTLEGYLYEGRRSDGSSLASLVHPCRKRTGTLSSIPAEWLRFAFHDMATHNVDDGTGGLDGSIVYELGRSENFGLGFNQTLSDFEGFTLKYVSRADLIAIGAIFGVATCGGPIIPFRGGRVDVYSAGATGTPEPQNDLDTFKEMFRKQGFTQAEMIKLVACGHTMGGVRSSDFPQLVPASNTSTPNIADFDTTTSFDNKVVTEYLDGTTENVLVVTSNTTMASDLRVFSSDGNQTMSSISSEDAFASECQTILQRMIEVVPHGVTLTDEITLLPAKAKDVDLTIEKNQLVFKATLRLTQPTNQTVNKNRTVRMLWCDRYGDAKDCAGGETRYSSPATTTSDDSTIAPIIQTMGVGFLNYKFVVPLDSAASISKFWFEVDEGDGSSATAYNNEGDFYVVDQDQVIFLPTLSSMTSISNSTDPKVYTNRNGETFTKVYTVVAAVRDGTNPSKVYVDGFDNAIQAFPEPTNTTVELSLNSTAGTIQGYKLYAGTVQDTGFQLTLDFHADVNGSTYTNDFKLTTYLDNTPYVAPTTVNTTRTSTASSSSESAYHALSWTRNYVAFIFGFSFINFFL